jgi:hypothetical protein
MLLGWTSRDDVLDVAAARRLVTTNGLFRPFALVGGRAVATWGLAAGRVHIEPFADLDGAVATALAGDAEAVTAFLAG